MTDAEKAAKLGQEVCRRYQVLDHRWDRPEELLDLGATETGIPVSVNRHATEVDLLVGVGQVAPHRIAGFGGGAKIVQPGICGAVTTGRTHWLSAALTGAAILGRNENAVRLEMERVAAMVGLKAVVNVVLNSANEIVGCFVGAPEAAQRAAAALSARIHGVRLPGLADIVLIESFPADLDLWQATKAVAAAELVVKPGGVVVLVAPCPEGVSAPHPGVLEFGYRPPDRVLEAVRRGELTDLVVAAELMITGRVVCERARGILVSSGIPADDTRRLGMTPADSPQEALDMALRLAGPDASIAALLHGGEILPICPGD